MIMYERENTVADGLRHYVCVVQRPYFWNSEGEGDRANIIFWIRHSAFCRVSLRRSRLGGVESVNNSNGLLSPSPIAAPVSGRYTPCRIIRCAQRPTRRRRQRYIKRGSLRLSRRRALLKL